MSASTPRLRMFAGPNGSGKSTLKSHLPHALLGVYLNPDEMEREIQQQKFLDFTACDVTTTAEAVLSFFTDSKFLHDAGFSQTGKRLTFANNGLNSEPWRCIRILPRQPAISSGKN